MAYFGMYETKKGVFWYYKTDSRHTKRGFKTKRDAVKHYKESDYSKLQGIEIKNNVLFEDMVNIWLSDYVNSGVKESTIENRRSRGLPNLLKYYEGKRLNEITADNYFELLQQLKNRGYKKNTIHGIK
ncbi:hypothetical protein OL233_01565 [Vagococcus sp. PNs007]|uniref:Integrase SAM-like N-terminal domain-containing protein n=1 Tax=Vagococcus proximus TaxID=2991417 RepID=A0ABT5WZD1_9ENTE|nr:hypothetical protein [Vagococcus proximus]MDF0478961.1 hypothetical protein [Vagococcus proximus]